ncbi:MAG: 2-oxoacid:acceptor oxidoreductase subunit alpha [Melioribacteraceae bacterium]|nr:2-oxoacid:acceptor oxidoreductase subunit alpha [Melioribacteraceae bacterium]MCF8355643.1 2-oxoacid:acceptor oxidoreductase subunit alpha [Melioribacteraceae bacterium]MCF8394657.1 2-oxoacid:acceptor oxidoreductase subunit alpha [Melioribacteraceae bacterium]MCF8418009.1 2-oxoacid:acceptor oxidoreductase subunit alpha [Melioribacteraceae bacterium]
MAKENGKVVETVEDVTVMFAGDSGDGMQLTGMQFSDTTAIVGNDLSTLPDYPAEIRAPAGTLYGVSGFQLHFSSTAIHTPGDTPDVLVAMNPAALKKNLAEIKPHAIIITNTDSFDSKNLQQAHYDKNPLEDGSLDGYKVFQVPITTLTENALKECSLSLKEVQRCKNFFALGLMYWLYNRPLDPTMDWLKSKFKNRPEIIESNEKALKAGYYFGEQTEIFTTRYTVKPAELPKGTYRNISGNEATAVGFVAASNLSGLQLFLGSYPITPASDILHFLSSFKNFGVKTFQAEDEIAGIASAIGASFSGSLAITTTSGPGLALKTEAIGLAVMTELPLVIVDVQRGGPSTGLPTKTEQADLLQALYGRNGEAPVPVIAASTPSDCFYLAIEASRIALKYMTPVLLLTDGYIANGSEPWRLPDIEDLEKIEVSFRTEVEGFEPYSRDANLARPWAVPGTKGLEHRIGGLEKANISGNVSYDPDNHDFMVRLREEKVNKIQQDIPDLQVKGDQEGDLLVLGWGGTYGAITEAVDRARAEGYKVSHAHLKYIKPFPKNTAEVFKNFKKILIPELNLGQLSKVIRSEFLIEVESLTKIKGLPFKSIEVQRKIADLLGGGNGK